MIGTFRWNLFAGTVGLIGTFLMSISRNVLGTALIQSFYSFIFLFLFTFLIRWILGILVHTSSAQASMPLHKGEQSDSHIGKSIDYSTPDASPLPLAGSEEEDSGFAPLNPPKLTTKVDQDPEELVKALRRMTEE